MELEVLLRWREILLASLVLLGVLLAVFLLVAKYPASRHLGVLVLGYFGVLISVLIDSTLSIHWLVIGVVALVFQVYSSSFFNQNTRFPKSRFYPLLVLLLLVSLDFFFLEIAYFKWLAVGTVCFQVRAAADLVGKQSNKRGIQWFSNLSARLSWFKYFWLCNAIFLVMSIMTLSSSSVYFFTGAVLVLIGMIYLQIMRESGFTTPLPVGNKYKKSTLSPEIKVAILGKLEGLMADKFYLKDDATLSAMAKSLDTSTHHLSQVLNESKGLSFQELISQHRIREACRLIRQEENRNVKVESIAAQVGYNSKSAFNAAFKKFTEVTPSQYRNNKEVQTYREARLPDGEKPYSTQSLFSLNSILSFKLTQSMLFNFIKFFTRNLKRNKLFTLINLLGLSVGFASSLLIYLYIQDEYSFDQEIARSEDIYRIVLEDSNPQTRTPHPMAQAMVANWPEVEAAVSISPWYGPGLSKQNLNVINEETNVSFDVPDCFFADSTFFDVFDLEFVAGDPDALKNPMTIVITEEIATKFFGEENPIGKRLSLAHMPLEIAAVVKGMPKNAHFHFSLLLSYVTIKSFSPDNEWYTWSDFGHFNYIKVKPETDVAELEGKIPSWVVDFLDWDNSDKEALLTGEAKLALQPIEDIHLHSHLRWELEQNSNIQYVHTLSVSLIFILLIAAINYINLTTAKSVERAKEIGLRKTMGAVSSRLVLQFCLESIAFCLLAVTLALLLSMLSLDVFNFMSGKRFTPSGLLNGWMILKMLSVGVLIGLLAGYYPSLVLAGFRPTEVLKGKFGLAANGNRFRSILVVIQFAISAVLIASSLIVMNQIRYMQNKPLGYDQAQVVSFPMSESVEYGGFNTTQVQSIQHGVRTLSGVRAVSAISNLPGRQFNQNDIYLTNRPHERVSASEVFVDYESDRVLGFEIIKGRGFGRSYAADSLGTSLLINERAVAQLQLGDPIGQSISWDAEGHTVEGKIIGVIKDFHYRSLHEPIQPLVMQIHNYSYAHVLVKMDGNETQNTMSQIKAVYESLESDAPFDPHFLTQDLLSLYESEQSTLRVFSIFTSIAIFLSCLGLFGMATAMLTQRIKEIGVRKILGASAIQIMKMVTMRFVALILVALAIGLPVAYLVMQNWIMLFAYQMTFSLSPFIWSAVLLIIIALLSVSVVVIKIACTNPINSIRHE